MIIKTVPVTKYLTTNTYFYIDEQSRHGFLIDPAAQADLLLNIIAENDWIIEKILITHGHFDHIGAVEQISQQLQIPYLAHSLGKEILSSPAINLSSMTPDIISLSKAQYFNEGEIISSSRTPNLSLEVIHTPGHTLDGTVYYDKKNNLAFVGDTIFQDSIGATHFPQGNLEQLLQSIHQKILTLPDDVILYSGHGNPSYVKNQKANFL